MPVTFEVRENGRVACYVVSDPWVTNDLTSLYPQDAAHRDSVNFPVHTFMDLTGVNKIPVDVIHARQDAPAFIHANSGQFVVVGANALARRTVETIFRLGHFERARFFDKATEGWNYLRRMIQSDGHRGLSV